MLKNKKYVSIGVSLILLITFFNTSQASDKIDDWSMFMHDSLHTGFSNSTITNTNAINWSYEFEDDFIYTSPAIVDERLYLASRLGNIYCFNSSDGELIWNLSIEDDDFWSSPTIYDNKLYLGSWDGFVYCFYAINGTLLWAKDLGHCIVSNPTLAQGKLFIGSHGNKLHCLNPENGSIIWEFNTDSAITFQSACVYNDFVVTGCNDHHVYCINISNGDNIWNCTTQAGIWSSPSIYDGKVYVGSNDNQLYCIDLYTGDKIWTFGTGGEVWSSAIVYQNRVYLGDARHFNCLNAQNGDLIWQKSASASISGAPALADGKIFSLARDGNLSCYDIETEEEIWRYDTGKITQSSPVIYDGKVYALSLAPCKIFCFGSGSISDFEIKRPIRLGRKFITKITNTGDQNIDKVLWTIKINGGLLSKINFAQSGFVSDLEPQEKAKIIFKKFVFGFGRISIKIELEAENETVKTFKEYNGLIIGPTLFILREKIN